MAYTKRTKYRKMRVNARWGSLIMHVKKDAPAFAVIPGRFLKNDFGPFGLPGRYDKTRKNTHTSHTRGDAKKKREKTHLSLTHTATAQQQQQVLVML